MSRDCRDDIALQSKGSMGCQTGAGRALAIVPPENVLLGPSTDGVRAAHKTLRRIALGSGFPPLFPTESWAGPCHAVDAHATPSVTGRGMSLPSQVARSRDSGVEARQKSYPALPRRRHAQADWLQEAGQPALLVRDPPSRALGRPGGGAAADPILRGLNRPALLPAAQDAAGAPLILGVIQGKEADSEAAPPRTIQQRGDGSPGTRISSLRARRRSRPIVRSATLRPA